MNNPVAEIIYIANDAAPATYAPGRSSARRDAADMTAKGQAPRLHVVSTQEARGESADVGASSPASARALFENNLFIIESVTRFVCHRQRVDPSQAEEFGSEVMLRLVENDYDILRRFQHRSSLRTYLTVVIQRMFLDYRNRLWGKWRPSAEAQRLGPVAIRLERLIAREGCGFDQACEVMRTNEGVTLTRAELEAIAVRLPIRTRRTVVTEDALDAMPQDQDSAGAGIAASDARAIGQQIRRALAPAVEAMSDQDRLILRLRFQEGLGVVDIARALHLDQRPLYRRFELLLRRLKDALETAGIDRDAARDAIEHKDVDISMALLGDSPDVAVPSEGRPASDI